MNREKEKRLIAEFPILYKEHHPLYPEECDIPFHFECGDGWYYLLYRLSQRISYILQRDNLDCYAVQVKEKFGGLRFYMSTTNDEIENEISMAEKIAEKTCEKCGKPGELINNRGWMITSCKDCYE